MPAIGVKLPNSPAEIPGLVAALSGKASASHGHQVGDITDLSALLRVSNGFVEFLADGSPIGTLTSGDGFVLDCVAVFNQQLQFTSLAFYDEINAVFFFINPMDGGLDFDGDFQAQGLFCTSCLINNKPPMIPPSTETVTGRYYAAGPIGSSGTANSGGVLRATPIYIPNLWTFNRIGINVTSASSSGGLARLGIYNDNEGFPGTRLADAGTVSIASTGEKEATINVTIGPGWYWLAWTFDLSHAVSLPASSVYGMFIGGFTSASTNLAFAASTAAGPSSSLPSSFGAIAGTTSQMAHMWLRRV